MEDSMSKAFSAEDTCPKCGSHLILRDGQSGEFLACPKYPQCQYTQSLYGVKEVKEYKAPSPYCDKCNHTGLIPFKNDAGKTIPHAYLFCTCNPQLDGHSQPYPHEYTPELYDFPMSYSYYRSLCLEHGWPDPGPDTSPSEEEQPSPIEDRDAIHLQRQIDKMKAKNNQLQNNLNEHIDASKKRIKKSRF